MSDRPGRTTAAPPARAEGPWWRELDRSMWLVFIVASLGWMFDTMDQRIFTIARQPALRSLIPATTPSGAPMPPERRKTALEMAGNTATACMLVGWAVGGLFFGMMGDRWGRARTMALTILTYSLFTGLTYFSIGLWDFILYRFLMGLGVGGTFAAGVTLVSEAMTPRARPHALGLLQALSAFGNMTGSGINALVGAESSFVIGATAVAGWRLMFLVGVLPALLVVVILFRLRDPEASIRKRTSDRQAGKRLGDPRDLLGEQPWGRHAIIGLILALVGVIGLWGVGFFNPELSRSVVDPEGKHPALTARWVTYGTLMFDIGSFFGVWAFSWVTTRIGRRATFLVFFTLALVVTVAVFWSMRSPGQMGWMYFLMGFSELGIFGGYAIYFPELFPTRLRATGTAFCYNVGRVLAAPSFLVKSWLYNAYQRAGYPSPFRVAAMTLALVYLVGILVLPLAPETHGKPPYD